MLLNNGNHEGLFRGAVMQSGGPIPVGDIEHGQQYYDHMVKETGCSNQRDTLECLRKVPYATYKRAMDASPNFFAYQVRACLSVAYRLYAQRHAGTCAGLVASSRRLLPDRAAAILCSTWPRRRCSRNHRYGSYVVIYYNREFTFTKGNCDDEGSLFSISTINISYVDK
jgi:acetylcholinesterase